MWLGPDQSIKPANPASVSGYIANCAVVGCLAFWAPKAGAQAFKMDNADLIFGGVTVATGLLGTFAGGVALDFVGSTMSNAFLVRRRRIPPVREM